MTRIACFWFWIADHATILATVISAIAAGIIAWFTVTLAHATRGQLAKFGESINLGRQEFVSTHRPRIIIRNIYTQGFAVGGEVVVNFTLVNIGDSPATIISVDAIVFLGKKGERLPRALPLTACYIHDADLVSGQSANTSQKMLSLKKEDFQKIQSGEKLICIAGRVEYVDENFVNRRTGFARVRRDTSNIDASFGVIKDDEWEYTY